MNLARKSARTVDPLETFHRLTMVMSFQSYPNVAYSTYRSHDYVCARESKERENSFSIRTLPIAIIKTTKKKKCIHWHACCLTKRCLVSIILVENRCKFTQINWLLCFHRSTVKLFAIIAITTNKKHKKVKRGRGYTSQQQFWMHLRVCRLFTHWDSLRENLNRILSHSRSNGRASITKQWQFNCQAIAINSTYL